MTGAVSKEKATDPAEETLAFLSKDTAGANEEAPAPPEVASCCMEMREIGADTEEPYILEQGVTGALARAQVLVPAEEALEVFSISTLVGEFPAPPQAAFCGITARIGCSVDTERGRRSG